MILKFLKTFRGSNANFKVKPDAVISFPKSGRTWLRVMLDELDVEVAYTHAGGGHGKSRLSSDVFVDQEADFERILFLHRNVCDTAVSGYHQKQSRKGGYNGTISDFIRDPCHGVEKIMNYNKMWFDLGKTRGKMKFVSYEALRSNAADELSQILLFFGKNPNPDKITKVVEANSFASMKKREALGEFKSQYGKILMPTDPQDPNSFKVRKGLVGGYKHELSAEDVAWCDAQIVDYAPNVPSEHKSAYPRVDT